MFSLEIHLKFKMLRRLITVVKKLGTFGNCQRPVFSLGVSQPVLIPVYYVENNKSVAILTQSVIEDEDFSDKLPLSQIIRYF